MKVSIIIPTYNAESYMHRLLLVLKQQTISYELIIIDSSSIDKTIELVEPYADKIITIPKREFDHGGTRTKASLITTGEIIIFLTQDALPLTNKTLEQLIQPFHDSKVAAVYGRQISYEKTNLFGKHLRTFNYPTQSYKRTIKDKNKYGIKTAFLSDSFSAYRKSAMKEVDYFKDGLIVGEDNYIGAKLLLKNYTLAYVSEAKVYHSHSYSFIQEFQRYFDIGVFHCKESWILDEFGKAEGEGSKYIKSEFYYILSQYAYYKIPEFFLRNGLKYIGYKLGKNYKILPYRLILHLSMHKSWWSRG